MNRGKMYIMRAKLPAKTTCRHPERKHYSRGLCESCYQSARLGGRLDNHNRITRALDTSGVVCEHHDAPKVAHGLCKSCHYKLRVASGHGKFNRAWYLENEYGLTEDQYNEMLAAQNGGCAICENQETAVRHGSVQRLSVDHDHKTGAVRGLLCKECNHLIGNSHDNVCILEQAILYLKFSMAMPSSQERKSWPG